MIYQRTNIVIEPNFLTLRFLHNVFNNKDSQKVEKVIKERSEATCDLLSDPFMFLNGRSLSFFFAESYETMNILMKKISDNCDHDHDDSHIFMFDFEGKFCLENLILSKKTHSI